MYLFIYVFIYLFIYLLKGYRAFHGVAAPQSCETALSYYRKVASKGNNY